MMSAEEYGPWSARTMLRRIPRVATMVGMKERSNISGYRDAHFALDRPNLEEKRRQGKEHATSS